MAPVQIEISLLQFPGIQNSMRADIGHPDSFNPNCAAKILQEMFMNGMLDNKAVVIFIKQFGGSVQQFAIADRLKIE